MRQNTFYALFKLALADKLTLCAFITLCLLAILCFGADFFTPYSYSRQDLANALSMPTLAHIFGTDNLGRDLFARVLYGGRISFAVGFLATFVAVIIGTLYGMISGISSRRVDALMMRFIDIAYALPFTIFVIILMIVFGRSLWLIFVAIGAVEWLTMARIIRAMTLDIKQRQFVEASLCLGQSRYGIIFKHILPNLSSTIIVCATLTVPSVMLLEAFLSFLGLGVQAPLPSWGSLIKEGAEYMQDAPHLLIFPTLFFSTTLFCLNRIGEKISSANAKIGAK